MISAAALLLVPYLVWVSFAAALKLFRLAAQPPEGSLAGRPMKHRWGRRERSDAEGYRYASLRPMGHVFHPEFRPDLTPAEMLKFGVFGGKYMTDCRDEFPKAGL